MGQGTCPYVPHPGKALALTRSDIDFAINKVKVAKTYIEKTKKVQNSTKTA